MYYRLVPPSSMLYKNDISLLEEIPRREDIFSVDKERHFLQTVCPLCVCQKRNAWNNHYLSA
uniref:Uncharacterized protein n=1 Tax=Arion vulgaris TaxID=1028688 RepID=A0A0B7AKZ9_9EUPU